MVALVPSAEQPRACRDQGIPDDPHASDWYARHSNTQRRKCLRPRCWRSNACQHCYLRSLTTSAAAWRTTSNGRSAGPRSRTLRALSVGDPPGHPRQDPDDEASPHRSPARLIDAARGPSWTVAALICAQQGHRWLRRRHQVGAVALRTTFFCVLAGDWQPQATAAREHRVAAHKIEGMLDVAAARERRQMLSPGARALVGRQGFAPPA